MKNKTTIEQLVDMLGDSLDITICSDIVYGLELEFKELQGKINKTIEYINNHTLFKEEYDYNYDDELYLSDINDDIAKKDLLEILGGENEKDRL